MGELTVNVDDRIVQELELRAARNGQTAEEEHREILRKALESAHPATSLKELLSTMPDVGDDRDLERNQDRGRAVAL